MVRSLGALVCVLLCFVQIYTCTAAGTGAVSASAVRRRLYAGEYVVKPTSGSQDADEDDSVSTPQQDANKDSDSECVNGSKKDCDKDKQQVVSANSNQILNIRSHPGQPKPQASRSPDDAAVNAAVQKSHEEGSKGVHEKTNKMVMEQKYKRVAAQRKEQARNEESQKQELKIKRKGERDVKKNNEELKKMKEKYKEKEDSDKQKAKEQLDFINRRTEKQQQRIQADVKIWKDETAQKTKKVEERATKQQQREKKQAEEEAEKDKKHEAAEKKAQELTQKGLAVQNQREEAAKVEEKKGKKVAEEKHKQVLEEKRKVHDNQKKEADKEHASKEQRFKESLAAERKTKGQERADKEKARKEQEKKLKQAQERTNKAIERTQKQQKERHTKAEKTAKAVSRRVYVFSAGYQARHHRGGRSIIKVGNQQYFSRGRRGFNVVLLDKNRRYKTKGTYDTHARYQHALLRLLQGAAHGDWLIMSCNDECKRRLDGNTRHVLRTQFGAEQISRLGYRDPYILVAQKGTRKRLVEREGGRRWPVAAHVNLP